MEITSVEAIPLSCPLEEEYVVSGRGDPVPERPMTLLKVEDNDGTVGWGEAFGPPKTNAAICEELVADSVLGIDPFEVESLMERAYAGQYHFSRRGPLQCVLAGLDMAIWDLIGKQLGKPVHELLGGPNREEVVPYASLMMHFDPASDSLESDSSTQLEQAVDDGFIAAKIKIGRGIEDDVRRVKRAREVLGPDAYLMADMNGNYRTDQAIRAISALEPYDLQWVEEPILPHQPADYSKLKEHTITPLAAGEAAYSRFEFEELLESAVDIVQPDLSKTGFSEARYVAKRAVTSNIGMSPHCWNGPVARSAAIQFAAAVPAYPHSGQHPEPLFVEIDRSNNPLRDELLESPVNVSGNSIEIPSDPGLGVTPDPSVIDEYRV